MKYLRTFLLSLQVNLQYRADLIGWFVAGTIPSFALILVWLAILGNRSSILGFTRGDFIVYYFFQTLGWYIVGGTFCRPLGTRIKNGEVTKTLLKPYSVVLEVAVQEQAWKLTSIVLASPAIVLVFYVFRSLIHLQFSLSQVFLLVTSLIFGGIIYGIIQAIIGLFAFWMGNIWPLADFFDILLGLFGGRLVPIALMPSALKLISDNLPFKYIFYVPVSILLHKSQNPVMDIAIQSLFILIVYLLYRMVWRAGVRKYEAVGG